MALEAEYHLADDLAAYVGQWVAVLDHKVVHSAPTLSELLELVGGGSEAVVFQVFDGPCFFGGYAR